MGSFAALLVLGARVGGGALERRLDTASQCAAIHPESLIVVCGGRRWGSIVEADAMRDGLRRRGVASERIVRERLSLTTVENLIEARRLLRARELTAARVAIVTCDWHLPRALIIARSLDFMVEGVAATSPQIRAPMRRARALRERILAIGDRVLASRSRAA